MAVRLFVATDLLETGQRVALEEAQAHYLLRVMRLQMGAELALFDGTNGEWRALIEAAGKKTATLRLLACTRRQETEPPGPTLVFAPIKRAPLELLVSKAVELGVGALQPVRSQHGVVDRLNQARLQSLLIEAAEQCERLSVPELRPIVPLLSWLEAHTATAGRIYLAEARHAVTPLLDALHNDVPASFVIGPEGGFAAHELAALRSRAHVTAVSLGPRILRAETAALTALAAWQLTAQQSAATEGNHP